MDKFEIEKALTSFLSTKIDKVLVPGWKTIAPTYHEATQSILDTLVINGSVKKYFFDSFFFGEEKLFEEELESEKNNLLTFARVKLIEWSTYKPCLYPNYYNYREPQQKPLDMFSFLYILSEIPSLFDGIKEFLTSCENKFSGNWIDLFFSRRGKENAAKIFKVAWTNEGNWTCIDNARITDNCFSFNKAYVIMVNVD